MKQSPKHAIDELIVYAQRNTKKKEKYWAPYPRSNPSLILCKHCEAWSMINLIVQYNSFLDVYDLCEMNMCSDLIEFTVSHIRQSTAMSDAWRTVRQSGRLSKRSYTYFRPNPADCCAIFAGWRLRKFYNECKFKRTATDVLYNKFYFLKKSFLVFWIVLYM